MPTKKQEVEPKTNNEEQLNTKATKEVKQELTEKEEKVLFLKKKHKMRELLINHKFIFDGYNSSQNYEYIKAYQFKEALDKVCLEVGMEYSITDVNSVFENLVKSEKMYLSTLISDIVLTDIETGYEGKPVRIFTTGADNLDKGIYKANSMIIKTYLQKEFGVTGNNEIDAESDNDNKSTFVSPQKKEEMVKEIIAKPEAKKEATGELTTPKYLKAMETIISEIRATEPTYGDKTLSLIKEALESGIMPSQTDMNRKMLVIEKKYNEICDN